MVDSNLQREHILPSERAFAYKMKLDAMKNQGTRSDLTSTQVVSKLRSNEKLGAENDAYLNIPDSSLLLSYNPAQVLKLAGKHYLTGPVILVRTNMDGEFISLTIDQVYLFQKYLMRHSVTLMADGQKLPCICID